VFGTDRDATCNLSKYHRGKEDVETRTLSKKGRRKIGKEFHSGRGGKEDSIAFLVRGEEDRGGCQPVGNLPPWGKKRQGVFLLGKGENRTLLQEGKEEGKGRRRGFFAPYETWSDYERKGTRKRDGGKGLH